MAERKDQTEASLRALTEFPEDVTLVPYSGVQFLDFGFALHDLTVRSWKFVERPGDMVDGLRQRELIPLTGNEDADAAVHDAATAEDDEYSVRPVSALEPYLGKWVPVPVLRIKGQRGPRGEERYDPGPSAWARIRTVELAQPDPATGHTHRVQIALDTSLIAQNQPERYLAPERGDAEKPRHFRLVSDPAAMNWFLRRVETASDGSTVDLQKWVSDWLDDLFMAYKRAERPGRTIAHEDLPHQFEHWARYLAYLRLIDIAVRPPKMRFVNTLSAEDAIAPVNVDLVLDIGNSRTCGILIESFPGDTRVDLARSFPLELRDLSRPEFQYSGLFQSRAEFAELNFGNEQLASRSGRRNAFVWPSFVRIGPEAVRMVQGEEGTETVSGLSSPKRYIWDSEPMPQDWRFHNHLNPESLPRAVRAAMRHMNEAGDVLAQLSEDRRAGRSGQRPPDLSPAVRPRFSRSSLFTFLMAELLAQVLLQINDPASRLRRPQSELPRRLNRIILSLPTATSVQEQAVISARTKAALKLVWALRGLDSGASTISAPPELKVQWDEASCTQLVYLYSELTQKFEGRIGTFLELKGRPRMVARTGREEPTLRLACIDIGGGTTDLMVTTYAHEDDRVLHPVQTFREGFRIAGDDLVARLISTLVLPGLQQSIEAAGGRFVAERLRELFGGDRGGQDQQSVQRRRQYALRILTPLAEAVLEKCETLEEFERIDIHAGEVLGQVPDEEGAQAAEPLPAELLSYVEEAAADLGATGWRLAEMRLSTTREDVDAISREVFQNVLGNMCEVLDHVGADVVLLTGRPSRLPAVRSVVEELLVVPPHRLVSMHRYRAGRWYPFRDPVTQRIGDPKSTVAVGGMLIALAESRIANFRVMTEAFQMRSTARYIGEMNRNGQIPDDRILFSNIDLDESATRSGDIAKIRMFSPVHIGARQLPLERWTTTPLYRLDFVNAQIAAEETPLTVELEKVDAEDEVDPDDKPSDIVRKTLLRETQLEQFKPVFVEGRSGTTYKPAAAVVLKLQTLGFEDDYWLETGTFRI
ncbi:virulence factor SrfB [Poseidonocella sp. HB161398]|uniref:virulence factor SrfB n=1 Tax=Poseidonocella sp. HB161398 TaxID=2320855 RepID=UPI001107CE11|nr:virulence factor SrfB [Poseidonocella sp. HB161398]